MMQDYKLYLSYEICTSSEAYIILEAGHEYRKGENKIIILNDSTLRPQFLLDQQLFSGAPDSLTVSQPERVENNELNDFHLIYDTFQNGIAKKIIDRYRYRRIEYIVEMDSNGSIRSIHKYKDGKLKKKVK
jgi:hypothetical protein